MIEFSNVLWVIAVDWFRCGQARSIWSSEICLRLLQYQFSLRHGTPICKLETTVVSNPLTVVKTELLFNKYRAHSKHSVKELLSSLHLFPSILSRHSTSRKYAENKIRDACKDIQIAIDAHNSIMYNWDPNYPRMVHKLSKNNSQGNLHSKDYFEFIKNYE